MAENYANKEHHIVELGQHHKLYKKVVTHVTTTMTDSIEEFSESHWKEILDEAYKHYKKIKKKNGGKKKEKMLKRMIPNNVVIVLLKEMTWNETSQIDNGMMLSDLPTISFYCVEMYLLQMLADTTITALWKKNPRF